MKSLELDQTDKNDTDLSTRPSGRPAGLKDQANKPRITPKDKLKETKPVKGRLAGGRSVGTPKLSQKTRKPGKPVIMRGGVVYPIPSRKILDPLRKGSPKGEAIKAFREAINLNVRDFAFFIGVDPATVFRWETKRTGKLQLGSLSKVLKLVNSVAAGKPVKIPTVARLLF
jgi:hypothetical protein